MLVVTRKLDESLIISDNIEITVLEIGKDKVKIGINAPKEVKVIRRTRVRRMSSRRIFPAAQ